MIDSNLRILSAAGHAPRSAISALRLSVAAAFFLAVAFISGAPLAHVAPVSPVRGEHSQSINSTITLGQQNPAHHQAPAINNLHDTNLKSQISIEKGLDLIMGSGSIDFVSPNTRDNLDITDALKAFGGVGHSRFKAFQRLTSKIIDPSAVLVDSLGLWQGSAENSTLRFNGQTPLNAVMASASICGCFAEQRMVIAFAADDEGPDTASFLPLEGMNLETAFVKARDAGVQNGTIFSVAGIPWVVTVNKYLEKVSQEQTAELHLPFWIRKGHIIEIGDGSSPEAASKQYASVAWQFYRETYAKLPQIASIQWNWKSDYLALLELAGMGGYLDLSGGKIKEEGESMTAV